MFLRLWHRQPDGQPPEGGDRLKTALFYHCRQNFRDILRWRIASDGNAQRSAQVSVEIGRGSVPSEAQPSFQELEAAITAIPPEGS